MKLRPILPHLVVAGAVCSGLAHGRAFSQHGVAWPGGDQSSPAEDLAGALAGSTIEVIRSQATYYTRAAAFGPHIQEEDGLWGTLVPISQYHGGDAMHGCGSPAAQVATAGFSVQSSPHRARSDTQAPPSDWIALVERGGGCSFVEKVRTAQRLGAIAVVVGDAPSPDFDGQPDAPDSIDPGLSRKRLLTMYAAGDTSDVLIPSTFITRPSFLDLRRLISDLEHDVANRYSGMPHDGTGALGLQIRISRDENLFEWPLVDFALVLLMLPSLMTIATVIVHRIRQARIRRRERAPQLVVQSLPCLIVRGNGRPWEKVEGKLAEEDEAPRAATSSPSPLSASSSNHRLNAATTHLAPESSNLLPPGRTWFYSDECAICLCNFVEGERVRVLPCGHIFHRREIDDWLILQKRLCPVCKRDVTVPVPTGIQPQDSAVQHQPDADSRDLQPTPDATREDAPLLAHEPAVEADTSHESSP